MRGPKVVVWLLVVIVGVTITFAVLADHPDVEGSGVDEAPAGDYREADDHEDAGFREDDDSYHERTDPFDHDAGYYVDEDRTP